MSNPEDLPLGQPDHQTSGRGGFDALRATFDNPGDEIHQNVPDIEVRNRVNAIVDRLAPDIEAYVASRGTGRAIDRIRAYIRGEVSRQTDAMSSDQLRSTLRRTLDTAAMEFGIKDLGRVADSFVQGLTLTKQATEATDIQGKAIDKSVHLATTHIGEVRAGLLERSVSEGDNKKRWVEESLVAVGYGLEAGLTSSGVDEVTAGIIVRDALKPPTPSPQGT